LQNSGRAGVRSGASSDFSGNALVFFDNVSISTLQETDLAVNNGGKYSQSPPLPFTLSGSVNWIHGLNKAPEFVQVYLVCTTPVAGYQAGDQVLASSYVYDGNKNYGGVGLIIDGDSDIKIRTGNPIWMPGKNSGAHLAQPSHWAFVIKGLTFLKPGVC